MTRRQRDERNRKLAETFRVAYRAWRHLHPRERANVSIRARLNLGLLSRRVRPIVFITKRAH